MGCQVEQPVAAVQERRRLARRQLARPTQRRSARCARAAAAGVAGAQDMDADRESIVRLVGLLAPGGSVFVQEQAAGTLRYLCCDNARAKALVRECSSRLRRSCAACAPTAHRTGTPCGRAGASPRWPGCSRPAAGRPPCASRLRRRCGRCARTTPGTATASRTAGVWRRWSRCWRPAALPPCTRRALRRCRACLLGAPASGTALPSYI